MRLYLFEAVAESLCCEVLCYVPTTYNNGRLAIFEEAFNCLPEDIQELLMKCKFRII